MDIADVVDLARSLLRGRARRAVVVVLAGCTAAALWAAGITAAAPAQAVGCMLLNQTLERAHDQLDHVGETVTESQGIETPPEVERQRFPGC